MFILLYLHETLYHSPIALAIFEISLYTYSVVPGFGFMFIKLKPNPN